MKWSKMKNFLLISIIFIFFLTPFCLGEEVDVNAEMYLFQKINEERVSAGLNQLKLSPEISELSRLHSYEMMETGRVEHINGAGLGPGARICEGEIFAVKVGENLAQHVSVKQAHTALMESTKHRETILDPDFTEVGIGVISDGNYVYVTENFVLPMEVFSQSDAIGILLRVFNEYRTGNGFASLDYSDDYEGVLEANPPHIESKLQIRNGNIDCKGNCFQASYTTSIVHEVPEELIPFILSSDYSKAGIYVWFEKLPYLCEYKYKISIILSE